MTVTVAVEDPLQDDIRTLIAELNAVLLELTPPEYCSHLTVEQMAEPGVTVWIAREAGRAIACGALKVHNAATGEVKRMYTQPALQGRGIGKIILERVIAKAQAEGLAELVLETGHQHPAAWAVYEQAGFARCGKVLDYPESDYSVFYRKAL